MPSERVLVVGAGVSGSITAFWLAKYGFQVTVIERSRAEQKAGQGIEIEEPALEVVKLMGVLDRLNEVRTGELGTTLVDQHSRSWGSFDVGGISPTGALELMRGDLTEVLYKAADAHENVTYHFETTLLSLTQTSDKVTVELENRRTRSAWSEEFDLVIGADGVKSRTRQLVMGPPEVLDCYKPVGAYVAYFSIPKEDRDWPYSRVCHFPGRRLIWLRPVGKDSQVTSVYFIYNQKNAPALREANATGDRTEQKKAFADVFNGLGWETSRVVEKMMDTDNFYSDELAQVKLQTWSQDRVVLVGDAAWAPTPFTGEGNQLAIIGAWVLAQELSRNRNQTAFSHYENRLRTYVEGAQNIPLGGYAPKIFTPQSTWGIWSFRVIFLVVAWLVPIFTWTGIGSLFPSDSHESFNLEAGENE